MEELLKVVNKFMTENYQYNEVEAEDAFHNRVKIVRFSPHIYTSYPYTYTYSYPGQVYQIRADPTMP